MIRNKRSIYAKYRRVLIVVLLMGGGLPFFLYPRSEMRFERFSVKNGLSQSTVLTILQDSKGFMWFGTEDGLNRYDGYEFVIYKHNPDNPASLSCSKIHAIYEDREGVLWIGTENGLNRFDRNRELFVRCRANGPNSGGNNSILSLCEDRSGTLWIGTIGGGLNRMEREKDQFSPFKYKTGSPFPMNDEVIRVLFEDSHGNFWIGSNKGLDRIDEKDRRCVSFRHDPDNSSSLSGGDVRAIYEDSSGTLWIGTKSGLDRFIPGTETFTHHHRETNNINSLSDDCVYSICEEDQSKTLLIGTYGGGLNCFHRKDGTFSHERYAPGNTESLSNDHIHTIFRDRGGVFWIGTDSGLNKYAPGKGKFEWWNMEHSRLSPMVNSIFKDKDGLLWIGTDDGLVRLDRETGESAWWTPDHNNPDNPYKVGYSRIMVIHRDRKGIFWIGTHGGGLNRFDSKLNHFTHYKYNKADSYSLSNDRVYEIFEDRSGTLWIGTEDGLNQMDDRTGRFNRWRSDSRYPGKLSNYCVFAILEDHTGMLWIGTESGLNRFDRDKNSFSSWINIPGDSNSLSDNSVLNIHEDKQGTLWIGTARGLNKFDREKEHFTCYTTDTTEHRLLNDRIYGILEDESGYLWFSTNAGITRFNPESGEFRNYDTGDGLQSNEFNSAACFKGHDGEMFFGGVDGFNFFYPRNIKDNLHLPFVVITKFRVLNEIVAIGSDSPLKQSITVAEEIVLSYLHNSFSFEFTAMDFTAPEKNQYQYTMVGFDKGWVTVDAGKRAATYTNLSPGNYTFRVKGSNNDGQWNDGDTAIRITITPPFWKTWWFKALLATAVVFLLFGGYRYRTRRLREKLAEQERIQEILRKSRDLAEFRRAEVEILIAAISSILIAVDSNGEIFLWNESAGNIFGIRESQAIGRLFVDVLKGVVSADKLDEILENGLGEGNDDAARNIELYIYPGGRNTEDESNKRLLISIINPIPGFQGKKLGFLLAAEDITNRKEEERQRILSQKLESLGQMAGNIAHEIKSPLQYIAHNGQFVYDSVQDLARFYRVIVESLPEIEQSDKNDVAEKIKHMIERCDIEYILKEIPRASDQIVNGVSTVSKIVKSMKEYSHPGRGVMEKADINRMLESIVVLVQDKREDILKIETELSRQLPPIVCYPGELNQVFMNLLINSADAIREKGEKGLIKIKTEVDGSEVVISVSDTGCGIHDSIKDNIFNPFFTTKEVGIGTGQGLAMAHKIIIENHKGKLHFKSKVGVGTTFYIHLPIQEGDK
jgi:PAS domain S-box-containing protein